MGPMQTTWRAWVKRPLFMGDYRCHHHHRSRAMALRCARERADPDRDFATTEQW